MQARLSNKTLASILGVSATTISRWIAYLDAVPADVLEAEKWKRIIGKLELSHKPNSYEKITGTLHYVSRFTVTPSLAWLAGFVAGDGSLTRRHIFVYNKCKRLVDQAASIMARYGTVGRARRRNRFEAWLSSRAIASALADTEGRTVIISDSKFGASFIAGLYDAEGWISFVGNTPSVHLAMTDKQLLADVHEAMRGHFGIESRIRLRLKAGRTTTMGGRTFQTRKDFWELRIFSKPFINVATWASCIGHRMEHPDKNERARKILNSRES